MKKVYQLKINPVLKASHYQYYFQLPKTTASRHYNTDLQALGKKFLTYLDFYQLYEAFPDPRFAPQWVPVEVPATGIKAPKRA